MPEGLENVRWFKPGVRAKSWAATVAGLLLILGALSALIIRQVIPATDHMTHGFIAYQVASRLLVAGQLGPQAYDDTWFSAQVRASYDPTIGEILTPSLPTMSLLALPFVDLPPLQARNLWIWLNIPILLAMMGMLALVAARLWPGRATGPWWAVIIALACLFPAVAANFRIGQFFIFFGLLFVVALYGLVTEQSWLAGGALGLVLLSKALGWPFWLLLLVQKRWKVLAWATGTALALGLITLPIIGFDTWRAYLQAASAYPSVPQVAATAFQTTHSFWTHLLRYDPVWNPVPLANWPQAIPFLSLSIAVLTLGVTLWLGRSAPVAWLFVALTPLNTVLLPVGEQHHFVALLIPITLLGVSFVLDGAPVLDWVAATAALLLLFAPIPFTSPEMGVGWLALLAYPRLFGAWLIWLVALRRMRRDPTGQSTSGSLVEQPPLLEQSTGDQRD